MKKLNKLLVLLIALFFLGFSAFNMHIVSALTAQQKELLNQNILYYDPIACADTGPSDTAGITAGSGSPEGLTFPNLSPQSMAKAINEYIKNYNQSAGFRSVFTGMGPTFVSSAKNSDINPFFIVAIAQKESQLGNPTDFNVRKGNNAFGRTATESQPNFQGSRLWYWWSSAKASIDHNAQENQRPSGDHPSYMKAEYGEFLQANDLNGFMEKYAPRSENNTDLYIQQIKERMAAMAQLAGSQEATQTPGSTNSVQDLAKQMLRSGNITYWTNGGVNTRDVVVALSEGRKAFITAPGVQPRETDINPNILRFILESASSGTVMVNALSDKNHTAGSNHYKGLAVDLDKGNTTVPLAKLNEVAAKYGGTKNNETTHHHYDFTGEAAPGALDASSTEDQQLTESGCTCPAGSSANIGGNDNVEKAFNFFVNSKGFTPELAAAFIGNFRQESGSRMDPTIVNSIGATGIAQWLGGRKTNLLNFANEKGTEATDLQTQLEFVIHELEGSESAAYNAIKAVPATDPEYIAIVTHVIRTQYERPGEAESNDQQRITYAKEVFSQLKDNAGSLAGTNNIASSNVGCGGTSGGVFVSADGYSFPVEPQRKSMNSGLTDLTSFPCSSGNNCHGGRGSGVAFDIGRAPGGDASAGAKVYAFTSGTVQGFSLYKGIQGCYDFQLKGDDGFYYWYGHLGASSIKDGDKVTAGQAISTIGPRKCTGNGSLPHLHIDRGCTRNGVPQPGGGESCRDGERMKKLMNKLFEELPE